MGFGKRSKMAKNAADLVERQRIEEEEVEKERQARVDEVRRLNEEMKQRAEAQAERRQRRNSHELQGVAQDAPTKVPIRRPSLEGAEASTSGNSQRNGDTGFVRKRLVSADSLPGGVNRAGNVTSSEADKINQLVKKRTEEKAARQRQRTKEQEELAAERAREKSREIIEVDQEAASLDKPPVASPSPVERKGASKWLSARDRLAAMQRESDELKAKALGVGTDDPDQPSAGTNAAKIGAARAAAKVASGVFYTKEENKEMLTRMKGLSTANKQLEERVAKLTAKLDALGGADNLRTSPSFVRAGEPGLTRILSGKSPPSAGGSPDGTAGRRSPSKGNRRMSNPDSFKFLQPTGGKARRMSGVGASLLSGLNGLLGGESSPQMRSSPQIRNTAVDAVAVIARPDEGRHEAPSMRRLSKEISAAPLVDTVGY